MMQIENVRPNFRGYLERGLFMDSVHLETTLIRPDEFLRCKVRIPAGELRFAVILSREMVSGCILSADVCCLPLEDGAMAKAVESIVRDKSSLAQDHGCVGKWPMHGLPATIYCDVADNIRLSGKLQLLQALGNASICTPASRRDIGVVEQIVARMKIDARRRAHIASCTVDEALERLRGSLIRAVVDGYHNTQLMRLGGETPAEAWKLLVRKEGLRRG